MNAKMLQYCRSIAEAVDEGRIKDGKTLNALKLKEGKRLGLERLPSNPDILANLQKHSLKLREILSIKPLRTLSGVAPVAIMTKPISCPHGTCIYCPGGPESFFGSVPQSYTGHEPATMRAISNNFDSYLQAMNRISQYYATAHNPEKLELIIMGGTFPSFPREYREEFVSCAFQAANDFSEMFFEGNGFSPEKFNEFFSHGEKHFGAEVKEKLLRMKRPANIEREHARNEKAKARIVSLCIETKPDWCREKEVNEMLGLGTTRVELGVQSIYNDVLKYTNRGHGVEDSVEATRLLKDSGLKVAYHMMPGQPLSSREKDIEMFREIFANPDFRPDGLKIYPCMVMPGTALARLYEKGRFTPLSTGEAAEIIAEASRFIPYYARVYRIQRDIPTKFALAGIDRNNLRQIVEMKMSETGIKGRDIRARETGINRGKGVEADYSEMKIVAGEYAASSGTEIFISIEDEKNDLIAGFCRLRKPFRPFRKEFTENTCCIRELHVFGPAVALGEKNPESEQHKGFGKRLVLEAEKIAAEKFDAGKMLVISGVGARDYYARKLGYGREGAYMSKRLEK